MEFKDHQWEQIKNFLPGKNGDAGRFGLDNRRFVEAVMWVARNGGRWRSLPDSYGKWNSVFQSFRRWSKNGIWQVIFNTLAVNSDNEWLMIDSAIVRAHQSSSKVSV